MSLADSTEALFNQAKTYHHQGRYDEAIHVLGILIERDKNYMAAYSELSVLFHKNNRADLAQQALLTALAIDPDHTATLLQYADFLTHTQHFADALECYERVLTHEKNNFDALSKKAIILQRMYRNEEALIFYDRALSINSDDLLCLNNKGSILFMSNHYEEALNCFLHILPHAPHNDMIHTNIANCFTALGQYKKAFLYYDQSLAINPNDINTITAYANLLSRMGYSEEAREQYSRILRIAPETAEARWAYTILSIMAERAKTTDDSAFEKTALTLLAELEVWCSTRHVNAEQVVGLYQFFGLAYYGQTNNIAVLRAHGQLCCRLMQQWLAQQKINALSASPTTRVKIGIISADMDNPSVWHALIKGIIAHLDKTLFEIHLFCLKNPDKEQLAWATQHCKHVTQNLFRIDEQVQTVLNCSLNIILYPAVGMDMATLQLASLRLAPIQMAGWGHPETSGLPTIDYYLSSEAFEPPDAQYYYTEQLLTLPHIGTCYTPLEPVPANIDWVTLNVNIKGPVLIAPGMVLKYQPEYDYLLIEIVKRLKICTIIFFKTRPLHLCQQLENRLRNSFAEAHLSFDEYVYFIPWQKSDAFFSLMKQADVFLDPVGFSGFNTVMQAMECGLPIVTKEGRFMRGRFGSGILRRCGLDELVATTDEEYIQIAVKLAVDKTYRQAIKQKIIESHAVIFDDKNTIKTLETILLGLIKN